MPVSKDQLRELLAERSDPARDRPAPQERIATRIRKARIHRAAGAGLLGLAVAAGVVSGVTLAHDHAAGHTPSYSGRPLPARFTASDGAAYRRLAVTDMTDPAQRSAALTVTAGSDPVDVMAACDAPESHIFIGVKVNGTLAALITCQPTPQTMGVSVRPGQVAHVTFVRASSLGLPDMNADWQFAAYAWKPPATVHAAPAAPRLPRSFTGPNTTAGHGTALRRLVASRSGDWPGDRTVTVTVPGGTGNFDVSMVCAGAIAGRLQVSLRSPGMKGDVTPCRTWTPGQDTANDQTSIVAEKGKPLTLILRIEAPSGYAAAGYAKRAASWTLAVYEEQT
jgi:hypothetical protein